MGGGASVSAWARAWRGVAALLAGSFAGAVAARPFGGWAGVAVYFLVGAVVCLVLLSAGSRAPERR